MKKAKIGKEDFQEWSSALPKKGYSTLTAVCSDEDSTSWEGVITFPYGVVTVYLQGGKHCYPHTSLTCVINGKRFTRSWARRWEPRTCLGLARNFINDLILEQKACATLGK